MDSVRRFVEDPMLASKPIAEWDVSGLLKLMWEVWNEVFWKTLGFSERSLVSEIRDWRNDWAHQEPFSTDDCDRALDSIARLLTSVSAKEADDVGRMKMDLRRLMFDEQVRSRDASRIADEVIAHLSGLVGAEVRVTLEIAAEIPSGAPDQIVRTVTENGLSI
jgi:Swt1-like HEPN